MSYIILHFYENVWHVLTWVKRRTSHVLNLMSKLILLSLISSRLGTCEVKVSHGTYSFYLTYLVLTKNVNKSLFNFDLGGRMGVENILYRFPGRFGDGTK